MQRAKIPEISQNFFSKTMNKKFSWYPLTYVDPYMQRRLEPFPARYTFIWSGDHDR